MSGRSGLGWYDVTSGGQTVGFVVKPSRPNGKWHGYLDRASGNAKRVGSASDREGAAEMVRRAHEQG